MLQSYEIDKVGLPSEYHPPPENATTYTEDYISVYAKLEVTKAIKDKVKYYVSPTQYIMFYLNYEKIKRACTFCGVIFHNVQFCPARRKLILHLLRITAAVPFSYLRLWMVQPGKNSSGGAG